MRTITSMLLTAFGTLLWSAPAHAEGEAKWLLANIDAGGTASQTAKLALAAFEIGFSWANTELRFDNRDPLYCTPPKLAMTPEQDVKIMRDFLAEHPEQAGYPAAAVLLQAMKSTFPCAGGGRP